MVVSVGPSGCLWLNLRLIWAPLAQQQPAGCVAGFGSAVVSTMNTVIVVCLSAGRGNQFLPAAQRMC